MKLSEMLELYRNAAQPGMKPVADEFLALSPSEQRELLFWMVVDASTNPTKVQTQNARN